MILICFVEKDHISCILFGLKLFDTAQPGIFNSQTGFFEGFPDGGFRKGFPWLHMSPGKTDSRPPGIYAILHQDIACSV